LLRKVSSEPILRAYHGLSDEDELPPRIPDLQQYQQQQYQKFANEVNKSSEEDEDEEDGGYPTQQWQRLLKQEQTPLPKLAQPEQPVLVSDKSIGSMFHPDHCTPCSFFCYSLRGCNRGSQCEFCHEDHPRKARRRGRKKRRGKGAGNANTECGTDAQSGDSHDGDRDGDAADSPRGPDVQTPPLQRDSQDYRDMDADGVAHPPAPTPELLLPLLTALECLAPLPLPRLVPRDPSSGAAFGESATLGDFYQTQSADARGGGKLSMWYHESTFVLEVGDEKHVIPFLNCNCELQGAELKPLTFRVNPELPEGLRLDPATGVIKGTASTPTECGGYSRHTVTASNSALSTSAKINISVRPRTASWCDMICPGTTTTADMLTDNVWLASDEFPSWSP
jgi:hypothetical protein